MPNVSLQVCLGIGPELIHPSGGARRPATGRDNRAELSPSAPMINVDTFERYDTKINLLLILFTTSTCHVNWNSTRPVENTV